MFYESDKDMRSFVLGGFIVSRSGRTLKLDPPLPSRDWESRDAQEVAIEFRRHRAQTTPAVLPAAETEPVGAPGSFVAFLAETTPGGAVTAQMVIVVMVYLAVILKTPGTVWGVWVAAITLIMTPWVPVLFGFGDTIAASINLINVPAGAFVYKVFAARTE